MALNMRLPSPNVCVILLSLCTLSFFSGCASTPTWPMENIGAAQFSGSLETTGGLLIVPTASTRTACQQNLEACKAFASNLAYAINTSSGSNAHLTRGHETMAVVFSDREMVESERDRVNAEYLVVWELGIFDDRNNFSFGPDALSISTLKIIDASSDETSVQLLKPYGLINPNTERFVGLARELGIRLGGHLAPHL